MKSLMKRIYFIVAICFFSQLSFGQTFESTAITKKTLERLTKEVDKEAEIYRKAVDQTVKEPALTEFTIDTFRIERLARERSALDYSTSDMNITTYQMIDAYDKLLNKYYKRLLDLLKAEDKDVLIQAQRAWLSYREKESKLRGTLKKEEYSGGGTIQSILANNDQLDFLKERVIDLFYYYSNTVNWRL